MAGLEGLASLIYHEKQQQGSMLCAQHALNSLLRMFDNFLQMFMHSNVKPQKGIMSVYTLAGNGSMADRVICSSQPLICHTSRVHWTILKKVTTMPTRVAIATTWMIQVLTMI
jgi:hypothetical protein